MILKYIKFVSLVLLLNLTNISLSAADTMPVQVYVICGDSNKPLKEGMVFVTAPNGGMFVPTDENGTMLLNTQWSKNAVIGYLAKKDKTILVGCYSHWTRPKSGQLFLGAPGSICPKEACRPF